MTMLDNKKASNGFTIVELIIALSVSAVVLAAGYDLFRVLRNIADKQDRSMAQYREIVDTLEQIREDLLHAVPTSYGQGQVFIGNSAVFDSEKSKLLKFYSLCVTGYPDKICGTRRIHRIEYELVTENDSIHLYRLAVPVIGKNKSSDDKSKKLILDKIEHIKIFFHDGGRSLLSFSSKQRLPVYIGFELTANGQTWPLMVKLPCGVAETEQYL